MKIITYKSQELQTSERYFCYLIVYGHKAVIFMFLTKAEYLCYKNLG